MANYDPDTVEDEETDTGSENLAETIQSVDLQRRKLLGAVGATGTVTVAGCLGLYELEEPQREPEDTRGDESETETGTEGDESETETGIETDLETFDVEWVNEGETISVPGAPGLRESDLEEGDITDAYLLWRALDEGFEPPWQCGRGVCGVCTGKVDGDGTEFVEHGLGEYANGYLSQEQIEAGYVLTCAAHPKRDFAIETGMKDEADRYQE